MYLHIIQLYDGDPPCAHVLCDVFFFFFVIRESPARCYVAEYVLASTSAVSAPLL